MEEHKPEPRHFARLEEAVTGTVVEFGPDHLTIHDSAVGEDIPVRIDDRTKYAWTDPSAVGQLRDGARVKVGFYIAGGVHWASEVLIQDPGTGEPVPWIRQEPHVH